MGGFELIRLSSIPLRAGRRFGPNGGKKVRLALKNIITAVALTGGAYDSVLHDLLCRIALKRGCPSNLLQIITHFLDGKTFYTTDWQTKGDIYRILRGVPRSYPLSPILFTFHLNPLQQPKDALPGMCMRAYADNILLSTKSKHVQINVFDFESFLHAYATASCGLKSAPVKTNLLQFLEGMVLNVYWLTVYTGTISVSAAAI